jgi:Mn2+/Fe2+ NRAMP family transporter
MHKSSEIISNKIFSRGYLFWLIVLVLGTLSIFFFFISEMGLLIKIATILSFLTAPFYAIVNYKLLTGKHTPKEAQPSKFLKLYSIIGIVILLAFSFWYLSTL